MTSDPVLPVIAKYLASCGISSRRGALELIQAGKVAVNGVTVTLPSIRIKSDDKVTVDGKPVKPEERKRYIMLNKPRGYTCSNGDIHAKKLAVELITVPERLVSAGRLDKDSEGLIIFSNDGTYIHTLGHPSFNIRKRYHVRLDGELTDGEIGMLKKGISDNGELLKPDNIVSLGECLYEFTLNEGRNREIRRMAARCGRQVRRLIRVSIGKLRLGNLPPGQWRDLTEEEIGQTLSQDIS
ncbi:MAG: rRNA pseudouridine synthase [Lentisphaeria bacterium]|nr:rRNA pseudouridine synthase [Lentisphaeria bacterium]